jgi:hypothetical protein
VLARVTSVALAQDPLPLYPEDYKIIVENERVRVLDFRLRKGAKEGSHSRRSPGGVHAAGGLAQRGGAGDFERRKDQGWMTEITWWKRVPE